MSSDLFDDVEPPEQGFDSTRPDPVIPPEPKPRRDPHRRFDLFDDSRPAPDDADQPVQDVDGTEPAGEEQQGVDLDGDDFDIAEPSAADPSPSDEYSEFAYTNDAYGPSHREPADAGGQTVQLDDLLDSSVEHEEPDGDDTGGPEERHSDDTSGRRRRGLISGLSAGLGSILPSRKPRTTASGDADPAPDDGGDGDEDEEDFAEFERISEDHHRRGRRRRRVRLAVLGVAGAMVLGAGLVGITRMVGPDGTEAQQTPEWATSVPSYDQGGSLADLFSPADVFTVETAGAAGWFAAGVAEYDEASGEVALYSLAEGEQLASVEVDGFEYFVEFSHDGDDVLGIRTAEGLTAVDEQGSTETFEFDGSLSVEGSAPLVFDEESSQTHLLDFDQGLVEFSINNSLPAVAADDSSGEDGSAVVYQVDTSSGEVVVADVEETTAAESVSLQPVSESAQFSHFGGIGHGFAAAVWQTEAGDYVGIHDVATGEAESVLPIDGRGIWEVGRGSLVAVVEDHAVSLATGELVGHDPQMETGLGPYPVTEDRRFFVDGAFYSEDETVLGGTATTMFVRTPSGDVASYDRQGATG